MGLIYLAAFYVGVGLVVARINAKHNNTKFDVNKISKMEWIQILKWPLELF